MVLQFGPHPKSLLHNTVHKRPDSPTEPHPHVVPVFYIYGWFPGEPYAFGCAC